MEQEAVVPAEVVVEAEEVEEVLAVEDGEEARRRGPPPTCSPLWPQPGCSVARSVGRGGPAAASPAHLRGTFIE